MAHRFRFFAYIPERLIVFEPLHLLPMYTLNKRARDPGQNCVNLLLEMARRRRGISFDSRRQACVTGFVVLLQREVALKKCRKFES